MKTGAGVAIGVLAVGVAAAAGYWVGNRGTHASATDSAAAATQAVAKESAKQERKPLYYRNPMGLPDTSPTPKKDPMGMDYIAVFAGEDEVASAAAGQIRISTDKIQKLGVKTEAASLRPLSRVVRAAGRIEPDERRTYTISPKFEGYVDQLHVNVTGQPVSRGQPLFEVYSPDLVSAQREYAIAAQGVQSLKASGSEAQGGMKQLADSSLARLKNWDISEEQIKHLAATGETRRTLTFRSPVSGIVTEKKAMQGMRFMPGEVLYQVADLSALWVIADVFEQDISAVKLGAKVKVTVNAFPDKLFEGVVSYIYPTLKAETRTVQVRAELANPSQLLKPGMFAQVEMAVAARAEAITIPTSAVIDSGTRRMVLVQANAGRFEPREVKLGARSEDYVEVLEGIKQGELVVTSANFLIDAESNLTAAVKGFGASAAGDGNAAKPVAGKASHRAEGVMESVDARAGSAQIRHGAIDSLKWPAMTMQFKLANSALAKDLKPGTTIAFEFVERQPGEWVITDIKPATTGAAASHAGH